MEVSEVKEEYKHVYPCEFSNSKTYPAMQYSLAEYHDASIGAFIIRRNIRDGKETRRSVLCYQCMRKAEPEDLCTSDEKPFMRFLGPEEDDKE
jgi:hypothetical protein